MSSNLGAKIVSTKDSSTSSTSRLLAMQVRESRVTTRTGTSASTDGLAPRSMEDLAESARFSKANTSLRSRTQSHPRPPRTATEPTTQDAGTQSQVLSRQASPSAVKECARQSPANAEGKATP